MKILLSVLLCTACYCTGFTQTQADSTTKPVSIMTLSLSLYYKEYQQHLPGVGNQQASSFNSNRSYYINGVYQNEVGWHYRNLKPYFTGCAPAMEQYNKALHHLKLQQWSMFGGLGVAITGGIMLGTQKTGDKTAGIAVLAAGGGLLLHSLLQDGLEKLAIKKAVKAYNKCENPGF